jgi:hypothetical protein
MTNTSGFSGRSKHKAEYPNITSALRTIPHDDSLPVSEPPENYTLDSALESEEASPEAGNSTREDQNFSAYSNKEPDLTTKAELNDLKLPKTKTQLLGSRLQQWKFLEKCVKVSFYRKMQLNIAKYFSMEILLRSPCHFRRSSSKAAVSRPRIQKNELNAVERRAWDACGNVCGNFFLGGGGEGIKNQKKQVELVEELLSLYHALGCNMSVATPFPALPRGIFFSPEKYVSRL